MNTNRSDTCTATKKININKNIMKQIISKAIVCITKELKPLVYCVKKDNKSSKLCFVCLDLANKNAVSTDGQVMLIKNIDVLNCTDYDQRKPPLIDPKIFKQMCTDAKRKAELTCTLFDEDGYQFWECECMGHISKVEVYTYPKYIDVLKDINVNNLCRVNSLDWKAAKTWIRKNKSINTNIYIKHEKYSNNIHFVIKGDSYLNPDDKEEFVVKCDVVPTDEFELYVDTNRLIKAAAEFSLAVPNDGYTQLQFVSPGTLGVCMPSIPEDGIRAWKLPKGNINVLEYCKLVEHSKNYYTIHINGCDILSISGNGKKYHYDISKYITTKELKTINENENKYSCTLFCKGDTITDKTISRAIKEYLRIYI